MDTMLGRCDIAANPPEAPPGLVVRSSFFSTHRKQTVGYQIAYPPGAAGGGHLPVCVYLHGNGGNETEAFDSFGFHRLLAGAVQAGVPGFAIATVGCGGTYFHPRASGEDSLSLVLEDFPTVLAQHGLLTTRMAVLGVSMGGFGALLAATEAPKRFAAVVASSPAVWHSYDEARTVNEGAFDSAEDWMRWGDLRPRMDRLKGLPVRIDCGDSDSFAPNLHRLQELLPDRSSMHFAKGCHDGPFWRSVAPEQLKLIGTTLAAPAPPS
jgi:esterase/lipase superfamily enzyme